MPLTLPWGGIGNAVPDQTVTNGYIQRLSSFFLYIDLSSSINHHPLLIFHYNKFIFFFLYHS
jgi:hypothetical protein